MAVTEVFSFNRNFFPFCSDSTDAKRLWIGPKDLDKPATCATNPEFAKWLKDRKWTEDFFLKWINNDLTIPRRLYFPLVCNVYSGRIIDLVWDANNVAIGAFVQV